MVMRTHSLSFCLRIFPQECGNIIGIPIFFFPEKMLTKVLQRSHNALLRISLRKPIEDKIGNLTQTAACIGMLCSYTLVFLFPRVHCSCCTEYLPRYPQDSHHCYRPGLSHCNHTPEMSYGHTSRQFSNHRVH